MGSPVLPPNDMMLDTSNAYGRPRREPLFNVPWAVTAILLVLTGIHAVRVSVSPEVDDQILLRFAFVPIRFTNLFDAAGVARRMAGWGEDGQDAARRSVAAFFLSESGLRALPSLLTYAGLHGGWNHLGLNAVWLLAFGTPVARRWGSGRFLLFLGLAAVAGALTHWALFPFGTAPLVGASAAVSGCMGAAVRFAFHARGSGDDRVGPPDALTLTETFRDRRTVSFLAAWFLSNALFGVGSVVFGLTDEPVAWQAHIGGFLVGLLLFPLFDRVVRRPDIELRP